MASWVVIFTINRYPDIALYRIIVTIENDSQVNIEFTLKVDNAVDIASIVDGMAALINQHNLENNNIAIWSRSV